MALLEHGLRGLIPAACVAVASCGGASVGPPRSELGRYLHEASFRRQALESSLTTTDNRYARLRLARYETGAAEDWSRLPAWNPAVSVVLASSLGGGEAPAAAALDLPSEAQEGSEAALLELGRLAFWRYPAMLLPERTEVALRSGELVPARYGLWRDPASDRVGGLVEVTLQGGGRALSLTCSSCHAAEGPRGLVPGVANARFDYGAMSADGNPNLPPEYEARLRRWGPGRVDVATLEGTEPIAVPDLRPLRDQRFLHRAGAVTQRSIASLAVRVETLLITGHQQAVRPPREVSAGLALYLWSLADALPPRGRPGPSTDRGWRVFSQRCAGCHGAEGQGGGLVEPEDSVTDGAIARSAERGTGSYRVPSLRGVTDRGLLLHDGSIAGLDALLDPRRGVTPEGPAAMPSHPFALDLPEDDRRALRELLSAL
ncbi:MAG: c-type cytochrome [Deltaproteobacteria bacterium]|nr:c-type cytochrome [Deltaproteobacteria bacterium]